MSSSSIDAKKELLDILDFYKYKVQNNFSTMGEINSVLRLLEENMEINGGIADFARFYNVPESQVRATIARKLIAKPKRKVLYPFHKFVKIVPELWRKKKED